MGLFGFLRSKSRGPVHVAYSSDEKYMLPLTVSAFSLIENYTGEDELNIHFFLCGEIRAESLQKLKESLARVARKGIALHFIPFDLKPFEALGTGLHFSSAAYTRLFLYKFLPPGLSKALYLDADTLILEDISPLYRLPVGERPLLAARDWIGSFDHPIANLKKETLEKFGVGPQEKYFNSGVLLLNLDYWREKNLGERLLGTAKENPEALFLVDQNLLNLCLHGMIGELDPRWNRTFINKNIRSGNWNMPVAGLPWDPPKILHFVSDEKPWLPGCELEERFLYYEYWRKTAWGLADFVT